MTRLHISENCKQLKIMSITINIRIDNALFYLFHITQEQSLSHMETFFMSTKFGFIYSLHQSTKSKIFRVKSLFVNFEVSLLFREKKSSSKKKKLGEKKMEVWKSLSRIKCRFLFNFLKKQCLYLRNIINM